MGMKISSYGKWCDQLSLNEMPPQKKPRPDEEETRKVIEFLTV